MVDRLPPKDSAFPTAPPEAWPALIPPRPAEPEAPRTVASSWGPGAWAVLAVAVVFSILVTYGLGWALARDNRRLLDASRTNQSFEEPPTTPAPATSTTQPRPSLFEILPELAAFVVQTRNQEFRQVPSLLPLSDDDFGTTVGSWLARRATTLDLVADRYKALGVLSQADWATPLTSLHITNAPLAYDVESNSIAIRNRYIERATPFVRAELVRVLARVLDSQVLGVAGPPGPFVDSIAEEAGFGSAVVAAGSAEFVVQEYKAEMTAADRSATDRDTRAQVQKASAAAPRNVLLALDLQPAGLGSGLIGPFIQQKGLPGLDALLASPPLTSAQVLRGELGSRDRRPPIDMSEPVADGAIQGRGAFGANDLDVAIGKFGTTGNQVPEVWAGGRYVIWEPSRGKPCIRFRVAGRTSEATQLLLGIVDQWAATSRASVVTITDPKVPGEDKQVVQATRCS